MYTKYKRNGIGNIVLDYIENQAREFGYNKVWLEIRKLNIESCDFYLKNG